MLQTSFLLMIVFLVAMMLVLAFGFLNYKIKKRTFDFYMMFLIGIIWAVLGFIFKIWFLVIIGVCFFLAGFIKRSQWTTSLEDLGRIYREEISSIRDQKSIVEKIFSWLIFLGVLVLVWLIVYIILR